MKFFPWLGFRGRRGEAVDAPGRIYEIARKNRLNTVRILSVSEGRKGPSGRVRVRNFENHRGAFVIADSLEKRNGSSDRLNDFFPRADLGFVIGQVSSVPI